MGSVSFFLPNLLGFSVLNLTYFSDVLTSTLFFCGSILCTFELLVWLRTQTIEAKVQQLSGISGISSFKDLTYFSVANTFPRCNCSSTLGPDVQTANILIEWMFPFFSMWREMLNELGYTFTFSTVFYCEILFKMSWKFCSPKIKTVIFIPFKTFLSIVLQRLINKIKRWAATERQPIPRWSTAAIKWQAVTFQNGLGEDRTNNNISEWKFGRNVRIQNRNLVSTCHTWSSC